MTSLGKIVGLSCACISSIFILYKYIENHNLLTNHYLSETHNNLKPPVFTNQLFSIRYPGSCSPQLFKEYTSEESSSSNKKVVFTADDLIRGC